MHELLEKWPVKREERSLFVKVNQSFFNNSLTLLKSTILVATFKISKKQTKTFDFLIINI